jgi:hypothetical protein
MIPAIEPFPTSLSRAPQMSREPSIARFSDYKWRDAVRAVYRAERAYLDSQNDEDAPDRLIDLLWLALWRAERHRDHVLRFLELTDEDRALVSHGSKVVAGVGAADCIASE